MKTVVLQDKQDDIVCIKDVTPSKIYAAFANQTVYKLHVVGGRWVFVACDGSTSTCSGYHETIEAAVTYGVKYSDNGVTQFDNQQEFFEWATKMCKVFRVGQEDVV